jgi:DNA-binding MarR family transcriptional regulator
MRLEELHRQPGHLIRRAQQIAVAMFIEECAAFDLTPVQYAAMVAIQENEGIDATRLSSQIAFDRSTLGNVLERLEARGLIERYASPEDKRVKLLRLTPQGRSVTRRAEQAVKRTQERILAPLDPAQRRVLLDLLAQLVEVNNDASRVPQRSIA